MDQNVQIFTIVEIQFSETAVVEMQFTFSACLNILQFSEVTIVQSWSKIS